MPKKPRYMIGPATIVHGWAKTNDFFRLITLTIHGGLSTLITVFLNTAFLIYLFIWLYGGSDMYSLLSKISIFASFLFLLSQVAKLNSSDLWPQTYIAQT